jgi:hypothetical protein
VKAYDAGLCWDCKRAPHRPDRVRCDDCAKKDRARAKAAREARACAEILKEVLAAESGTFLVAEPKPRSERRCSACGQAGHYRKRCPQRRAA